MVILLGEGKLPSVGRRVSQNIEISTSLFYGTMSFINGYICGLGASVECERVERTFNAPRLKSQICLIGGNGFVCSLLNELNSKKTLVFS